MKRTRLGAVVATAAVALSTAAVAAPSSAAPDKDRETVQSAPAVQEAPARKAKRRAAIRILSFNDFHGRLRDEGGLGGAPALAAKITELRQQYGRRTTVTAAAGDLIGASQFESTIFQDEPTIEVLEAMGLQTSAVGNHEFDEGVRELLRIQHGGCYDQCFEDGVAYDGADFPYLAANVTWKGSGKPILPPYWVKKVRGVEVGFIGVVTDDLPVLVNPSGIRNVDVGSEAEAINHYSQVLSAKGVKTQVVLMHEGSAQTWEPGEGETPEDDPRTPNTCIGLEGPVAAINDAVVPQVDAMVTGHSHEGYVCMLDDPRGNPRPVTQASDYGSLVTATKLVVDRKTGNVLRDRSKARNHEVTVEDGVDETVQAIVQKWLDKAAPLANEVVGSVTEDITGDSSGDRGAETPMGRLVADSILWGTQAEADGGAEIAFMNTSGVRDSFIYAETPGGEQPGEITYGEAGAVAPFGNLLVTLDLTGADIEAVLNQQWKGEAASRPVLALNPSEGFTYDWDPEAHQVVPGSMELNGEPVGADDVYRVATLNFLADGGDGFTAFGEGENVLGGPSDLENLVAYLEANPGLSVTDDRVGGL
ncbi:bifunctional metallophosphatase/5'-nucleotidase [Nocardioides aestuarii]|uniref:Bifunctional metallophosphatase/5'-nucleotidase n=1 Tax=Nocardioides aestuarii TaxID=252231 RepID=A0ABW4TQT7_9ACTN